MIQKYLVFGLFGLSSTIPNNVNVNNKSIVKKIKGQKLVDKHKTNEKVNNNLKKRDENTNKVITKSSEKLEDDLSPKIRPKDFYLKNDNQIHNLDLISRPNYSGNQSRRFYKDIYSSYSHSYSKDKLNSSYHQTSSFNLLKWNDYASSWDEFKRYYGNLNFDYYGKVEAISDWKVKGSDYNSGRTSWSLNSIESGTGWQTILSYSKDVKYGLLYKTKTLKGIVYYQVWKSGDYIKGRFDFTYSGDSDLSNPDSQYVKFWASISYVSLKAKNDYSYLKNALNSLKNRSIGISWPGEISSSYQSRFSSLLTSAIRSALGSKWYDWWSNDIYYSWNWYSNSVDVKVSFKDPNNNKDINIQINGISLYVYFSGERDETKRLFENNINGRTLTLNYDYPTNINNHRDTFRNKITDLIRSGLGSSRYSNWKKWIGDYTFYSDNSVSVRVSYVDPNSGQRNNWYFTVYTKINFNQRVKDELNETLRNKEFSIKSNIPLNIASKKSDFVKQIDSFIKNKLKDKYSDWKDYIKYDFDWPNNKIKVNINFRDPNNKGNINWVFDTKVKIELDEWVKNNLDAQLKKIEVESDVSSSLLENRKKLDKAIHENVKKILGDDDYKKWKKYIKSISYDEKAKKANLIIEFSDPNKSSRNYFWEFLVDAKVNLSKTYWDNYSKNIDKRITVKGGLVIDPQNPNGDLKIEQPYQTDKTKNIFYLTTSATVIFNAIKNSGEQLIINGKEYEVIDSKFIAELVENDDGSQSVFKVQIKNNNTKENQRFTYEKTFIISRTVPKLQLRWLGWDPQTEREQKLLITPPSEGKPNPKYDKEINKDTGLKSQILWVKKKAPKDVVLDPINKDGDLIQKGSGGKYNFEQGYIAEGIVSAMGVFEEFYDPLIKSVERIEVDEKDLSIKKNSKWEKLTSGESRKFEHNYWSQQGLYLYKLEDVSGGFSYKLLKLGSDYINEEYPRFLDVVRDRNLIADFWSTYQGYHLDSYLKKVKGYVNSEEIQKLSFERVMGYWREYVSGVRSGKVGLNFIKDKLIDLSKIAISDLKINETDWWKIRNRIIEHTKSALNKHGLQFLLDYKISNLDERYINQITKFDSKNEILKLDFNIDAVGGGKAINNMKLKVINMRKFDESKSINFELLDLKDEIHNFKDFTIEELKKYISEKYKKIKIKINVWNQTYNFELNKDYEIVFPSDDEILKFIKTNGSELKISIRASEKSLILTGSKEIRLINNFDKPKPKRDDKDDGIGVEIDKPNIFDKKDPDDKDKDKNKEKEIIDFSKLEILGIAKDFSKFSLDELKKLINEIVVNKLNKYYYNHQYNSFELNKDYEIVFPSDDEILKFIKNNKSVLKISLKAMDSSRKLVGENSFSLENIIEVVVDDKKDPNNKDKEIKSILDFNNIKFKKQVANFSNFAISDLKNLLKDEIVKKLKEYYNNYQIFKLELNKDYEITFPSDDEILKFIKNNKSEIKITIQAINKDKVDGETYLELLNDFSKSDFEKIIDDKDKEVVDKKDPNNKDKETKKWIEKPSSQILISFIVLGIIMTVVIGFILKNRFSKGIGGRRIKRNKQNKNIKIEGVN